MSSSAQDYAKAVRDSVRGAWGGHLDFFSFTDSMVSTIRRGFQRAWYEGAAECDIKPSELTQEELSELDYLIATEDSYIIGFAQAIFDNSKANGGKLGPLLKRAEMWGNRYDAVRMKASAMACADIKKKWVWNPLKEHCSSCGKLNGRVYRNSVWNKYNVLPRSRDLACRGYRCGCDLVPTNEPATPGRPPSIP